MAFYQNLREEKEFSLDHVKLGEYFPLNVVIEGTFKIYQVRNVQFKVIIRIIRLL